MPPRQGNAFLGFRATPEYHERVETAAARMELEKATWLRLIVDAALNYDETDMSSGNPPAPIELSATVIHPVPPVHGQLADGTNVVLTVTPVVTSQNPSKPNPRDCPHPPQYRMGMRCNRCGSIVGKGAPRR